MNKKFSKITDPKNLKKNHLKILICSPSNAGCDEIARRLKDDKNLKIVRVGKDGAANQDCEQINLNFLAKNKYQELVKREQIKKSESLSGQVKNFDSKENLFKQRIKDIKSKPVPDLIEVYVKRYFYRIF